ncbi:MAG TPA: ATP-binding cassette domain-containing protein [Planctomycetota bacterium]|jgi:phospholipid/cholesterol/gamma-HCH transport system ATP-binding protein|nr:ATP-binding cassette domain-containing protein [Planctomycetota bacterium]
MALIELRGVRKSFGAKTALDGITFSVEQGTNFVILGASGGGKSTLLKIMIAALKADEGEVRIDGVDLTRADERELRAVRRKFGVLFQDGALLNSLTVGENVALPIRYHTDLPEETIDILVKMKLELVGLREAEGKLPSQISGGMRKRAALARAIALDPLIVFHDEPSSGLDPVATGVISRLIVDLKEKMGLTNVVITHDIQSAFEIADRIVLLHRGRIAAEGTVPEILKNEDPLVRQFITGSVEGPLEARGSEIDYYNDLLNL